MLCNITYSYRSLKQAIFLLQIPRCFVLRVRMIQTFPREVRYRSYDRKYRHHFLGFVRNIELCCYRWTDAKRIKCSQPILIIPLLDLANTFSARTKVPSKLKTEFFIWFLILWQKIYEPKKLFMANPGNQYPESGSKSGSGSFNTWTSRITLPNEVWYWFNSLVKFN